MRQWTSATVALAVALAACMTLAWPVSGQETAQLYEDPALTLYAQAIKLQTAGKLAAAAEHYRAAVALQPTLVDAYNDWALLQAGAFQDVQGAIALCQQALETKAGTSKQQARLFGNIGYMKKDTAGRDVSLLQDALAYLETALELDPYQTEALYNTGLLLDLLGHHARAANMFKRALATDPGLADAEVDLANFYVRTNDWQSALRHYMNVLNRPEGSVARHTAARAAFMAGQSLKFGLHEQSKALKMYTRSLELGGPDYRGTKDAMLGEIASMRTLCMWQTWDDSLERIRQLLVTEHAKGRSLAPYDVVLMENLPSDLISTAVRINAAAEIQAPVYDHSTWTAHSTATLRTATESLRVVYSSYDYRQHPMGYLTMDLICSQAHPTRDRTHNSSSNRIQAMAASYGPDDGSIVRQTLEACLGRQHFTDVTHLDDRGIADAIAERRPHIFIDLMAFTTDGRLRISAFRPAPIVVNYLGFPGSVSDVFTDYTILDRHVAPPEQVKTAFSEKVVYLPHVYQANSFAAVLDVTVCGGASSTFQGTLQCQQHIRMQCGQHATACCDSDAIDNIYSSQTETHGETCQADHTRRVDTRDGMNNRHSTLQQQKTVGMCSFNKVDKYEPASFSLMLRVLRRVPHALLLFITPSEDVQQDAIVNLHRTAAAHGIMPYRIEFHQRLSRRDHLRRFTGVCDLFVDTLVYGAHTTGSEALWSGVPLVTMSGYGVDATPPGKMPARVGVSLLESMGPPLSSLICHSLKELEDLSVHLLQNPKLLLQFRTAALSAALTAPLFDVHVMSSSMQSAFEAMWEMYVLQEGMNDKADMHLIIDPDSNHRQTYASHGDMNVAKTLWPDEAVANMLKHTHVQNGIMTDDVRVAIINTADRVLSADAYHIGALRLKARALLTGNDIDEKVHTEACRLLHDAALIASTAAHKQETIVADILAELHTAGCADPIQE